MGVYIVNVHRVFMVSRQYFIDLTHVKSDASRPCVSQVTVSQLLTILKLYDQLLKLVYS